MLYGYYFDPTYVLIVIGYGYLAWLASAHVILLLENILKYRSNSGLTGAQAAKMILESQGIYDVTIQI